ncbi:MAG: twin-arginine translocation signal domain-containing protein, partial [Opitutales bacterium]
MAPRSRPMSSPAHGNRRDFLKHSALAGLGLGLAALPSAEAKPDPAQLSRRAAAEMGAIRPRPA